MAYMWWMYRFSQPRLRGHLPGVRGQVQLIDGRLYAADSESYPDVSHVQVADVSQPDAPVLEGEFSISGHDVYVAESYAYSIESNTLHIFDISDIGSPTEVGRYEMDIPDSWSVSFKRVQVQGGIAYLTAVIDDGWPHSSRHRISVLDVSDPGQPILRGSHEWSEAEDSQGEIVVKGGICLCGTFWGIKRCAMFTLFLRYFRSNSYPGRDDSLHRVLTAAHRWRQARCGSRSNRYF